MSKYLFVIPAITIIIFIGLVLFPWIKLFYDSHTYSETHSSIEPTSLEEIKSEPKTGTESDSSTLYYVTSPTSSTSSTTSINLDIQFYSQAPYADWSMPYQEACEEASLILAYNFATDQTMTQEEFHQELLDLVAWETEYFGSYEHTTIAQTAEMLTQYYNFTDWEIIENPTIDDIKSELSAGNPIVAPFAGRLLGNPNYTGEGPYYHMMVLKGFDENFIITNDVGTRKGKNYQYTYETILNALHDWDDADITQGAKNILILHADAAT
jgi:hypothetical protein